MNNDLRGREGGFHYSQDEVIEILENYSDLLSKLIAQKEANENEE